MTLDFTNSTGNIHSFTLKQRSSAVFRQLINRSPALGLVVAVPLDPAAVQLANAPFESVADAGFLTDSTNDTSLSPYARTFFVLWVLGAVAAAASHYVQF